MKHVTILAPRQASDRLLQWLQRLSLLHVDDAAGHLPEGPDWKRPAFSTETADARIRELSAVTQVFDTFAPVKRPFVQGFVNLPLRVPRAEMERVVEEFDLASLCEECRHIAEQHREHERVLGEAKAELEAREFFDSLPFTLDALDSLRRTCAWIGTISRKDWEALRADERAAELMALQELRGDKRSVDLCVIALASERAEAERTLRGYGFAARALPALGGNLSERRRRLEDEVGERQEACRSLARRARELAQSRREVEILLGYWQAERTRAEAGGTMATSRRVAVLCGYVRAADVDALEAALARDFREVSTSYRDPTGEDSVPVSLSHSRLVKPIRFLVDMFGLPDYFSFDPTPYLSFSFLIFFGMCFGDVAYGLLLCAVAGYLSRKSRGYEGLHNFCTLFFYCGVITIIFGVLTGSWASDLWRPEYLGEGNPLLWIKEHTALVEPIDKAVVLLLLCLGIGIINQFYGIVLKGYGLLRRGKVLDAIFDAVLWLIVIPGFLIVVSVLFFATPEWLFRTGLVLLVAGSFGLVLTQGRHEKGLVAKAITGLVSIYGILGSYGCVSFVGDMLSYTRLMALGLTTAIVGMSFNIIAGLLKGVPWFGVLLFFAVVVFGHLFNFAVSMLGAFVHPARLIFLEFFSRFYEGGGVRFRPLSLDTDGVIVE